VLHQATAQVRALRIRAAPRGETIVVPADRMHAYFPPPPEAPTADDLHAADARWQDALERGRRYRDEAQAQVGPLLTPAETAQRLGVSPVTVNKWRRQDKLLGLRFDDHQHVYPLFQFADSPLQGERGVLRHLDGVLRALGDRTAWEKALFLLTAHPRLEGKTPVEVLRQKPSADVLDRLYLLAQHAGEMGA
jgi:transposase-like protein